MENKTIEKFELVDVDKLIPYVNNARTHSKEQINKLKSSLREFGFVSPMVIDKDFNVLVGHGRLMAAKEEGFKKVPCVFVENMTDAQKKAYILADNRTALDSGWDEDLLKVELEALDDFGFDLSLTGFDSDELNGFFDADNNAKDDNFDVEAELEKPKFSKNGDIWHLGRHTVICGDSTEQVTFERLLGDRKVNLVVTDAPYFIDYENVSGKVANDNLKDKEAYEFLMKVFKNFKWSMTNDASFYEFYATRSSRIFYDAFEDAGFKVAATLIWKKPRAPLMRTDWKFNMEPVIFGWKKDGKHVWYGDQKQTTIFEFDSIRSSKEEGCGHPDSKPVPMIAYLIKLSSQINGLVLDGFLGSASTLIACEQIDRTCFGVELEEKFVDVAVNRYKEFKGRTDDIWLERDGKRYSYEEVVGEQNE